MSVYVDDMRAPCGRMVMCHMVADTDDEMHAMADRIGVARKWHQKCGTPHSHYDVCMAMRARAVRFGAIEIDRYRLAALVRKKRATAPQAEQRRLLVGGVHNARASKTPDV